MKLRVEIEIADSELPTLAYIARNYLRENPQRRWNKREYKEAARLAVVQIVRDKLDCKHALNAVH